MSSLPLPPETFPWFSLGTLRERWTFVVDGIVADGDDRLVLHRSLPLDVIGGEVVVGVTARAMDRLTDQQRVAFESRIRRILGLQPRLRFVRRFVGGT